MDSAHRGLTVATARESDAPALLTLINSVQPHVPWTLEHLRWQYFRLPFAPAKLYAIWNGHSIVSLYAAIPQRVTVSRSAIEGRMVQDVMTDPAFRGRGFLHQLGAVCLDEMKRDRLAGYTFPNERSESSFRRNGWRQLIQVPNRRAPVAKSSAQSSRDYGFEFVENDFDASVTAIWEASGLRVGVCRDAQFLNWRYAKPGTRYHKALLPAGAGLLVLKVHTAESRSVVHILELLVKADQQPFIGDILRFCFSFAAAHGAESLTAWLTPGHPYAKYFDAAGLIVDDSRPRFIFVHSPAAFAEQIEDPDAWHLTQGDSDVY